MKVLQILTFAFAPVVLAISIQAWLAIPSASADDPPVIDPPGSGENKTPDEAGFRQPEMAPGFQLGRDDAGPPEAPQHEPRSDRYTILVADQSMSLRLADGTSLGAALSSIKVYADGVLCETVSLNDSASFATSGGKAIELGDASQADACAREGARVQFVDGNGFQLAEEFTLTRGAADLLYNFAPLPPGTGSDHIAGTLALSPQNGGSMIVRAALGSAIGAGAALLVFAASGYWKRTRGVSNREP